MHGVRCTLPQLRARQEWQQLREVFWEAFRIQKAAYRHANGGKAAPNLQALRVCGNWVWKIMEGSWCSCQTHSHMCTHTHGLVGLGWVGLVCFCLFVSQCVFELHLEMWSHEKDCCWFARFSSLVFPRGKEPMSGSNLQIRSTSVHWVGWWENLQEPPTIGGDQTRVFNSSIFRQKSGRSFDRMRFSVRLARWLHSRVTRREWKSKPPRRRMWSLTSFKAGSVPRSEVTTHRTTRSQPWLALGGRPWWFGRPSLKSWRKTALKAGERLVCGSKSSHVWSVHQSWFEFY